jgi:DNA invertase Pin-like site-specific DNA recombinase
MKSCIAYYRVSTDRQGASGLGLEAQRAAVACHIAPAVLLAEYTETESGKKHSNRPQRLAALQECRRRKATLVIAKLDRLGRNVAFISTLMESGADFVCCDNPHANRLMLHMLAAFAEQSGSRFRSAPRRRWRPPKRAAASSAIRDRWKHSPLLALCISPAGQRPRC